MTALGEGIERGILVAGAVAVVLAGLLFVLLPDPVVTPTQFEVRFEETPADAGPQEVSIPHTSTAEFSVPVALGNLSRVEAVFTFTDDLAASDPDRIRVEVVAPDGTALAPTLETSNPLPVTDGSVPPAYVPIERSVTLVVPLQEKPEKQIVTAASQDEGEDAAARRLAEAFTGAGSGPWTVRVTVTAGHCPAAELDAQRAASCRGMAPDGMDTGNLVQLAQFRTFHWHAVVSRL